MSFVSEICAAGLIAGTVPTKGSFVHRARSCDNTSVDAVLQAIATMFWRFRGDERLHDGENALDEFAFAPGTVGKPGVVSTIDEISVRADFGDLGENREAAKA